MQLLDFCFRKVISFMFRAKILGWLLLLALTACVTTTSTPSPVPDTPSGNDTGYPITDLGYPAPSIPPTPGIVLIVPTPSSGEVSVITGMLMVNPELPQPLPGVLLGLATIAHATTGTPFYAQYERTTAPRNQTDSRGRFVFADVPPGRYLLVIDKIREAILLKDPKDVGQDLTFDVEPGQVLDLGELVYINLPITPAPNP